MKVWFFILGRQLLSIVFLKVTGSFYSFSRNVCQMSKHHGLSVIVPMVCLWLYPVKMVSWKKHLIHLVTQVHMCVSWRHNCLILVCSRSALCIPLFSLQVTKMKVKGQDLIAFRICTASSRAFFLFKHLLNIKLIQNLKYVRCREWYNGYAV